MGCKIPITPTLIPIPIPLHPMHIPDTAFIGIDPTSAPRSFTYAALDRDLNLLALGDGKLEELTAFIAAQSPAAAAVNAPAGVNRGLVGEELNRKILTPYQLRRIDLRLAEHELRGHGINVPRTPASAGACPPWMQAGFDLVRRLEREGFKKYPEPDSDLQLLETNSQACYCMLAGQVPQPQASLEGRLQRQLILYERGLRIKDPMEFFEEITRYKMSRGIWPLDLLYSPAQLDALAAAYTAWMAVNKTDQILVVGDIKEGRIVLPGKELKGKY